MNGIDKVMLRISEIEHRFAKKSFQNSQSTAVFARALQTAETAAKNPVIVNMVREAAVKHGLDPKLVLAIADAESGFDPAAVSHAGAIGVMQLMPQTAASLGVRNIRNTAENIDGGVRYLKQLLTTFSGDITKAVAAYNAGPDAVSRYNGVPPYAETQAYVAKVLATYKG